MSQKENAIVPTMQPHTSETIAKSLSAPGFSSAPDVQMSRNNPMRAPRMDANKMNNLGLLQPDRLKIVAPLTTGKVVNTSERM
jgi:hypothetical protein